MTDTGTDSNGASDPNAGPAADPLAALYDPPPLNQDPGVYIPDIPGDVPLHMLSAGDAPAQSRPHDWDENGRPRLRYLGRIEFDILTKFTETLIVPPDGKYPIPPAQGAMNVDHYLAAKRSVMRVQIRAGLHMLNLLPLKSFKLPFRWMSLAARRKWAKRFESNKGSLVTKVVKMKNLVYMCWYADPGVHEFTGYTTPFDRDPDTSAMRRQIRERIQGGRSTTG